MFPSTDLAIPSTLGGLPALAALNQSSCVVCFVFDFVPDEVEEEAKAAGENGSLPKRSLPFRLCCCCFEEGEDKLAKGSLEAEVGEAKGSATEL